MWFASIDVGTVAQRTPVPAVELLADRDMKPPGIPDIVPIGDGTDPLPIELVLNVCVEVLNRKMRRKSFSPQTYMLRPAGALHMTADEWMWRVEFRDSGSWITPHDCGICESDMLKPPRFDELRT